MAYYPFRPTSRGHVRIKSANPSDYPAIFANYLSTEEDRRALREGVKMMRKVAAQSALDPYRTNELFPGEAIQTDEEIEQFLQDLPKLMEVTAGLETAGAGGVAEDRFLATFENLVWLIHAGARACVRARRALL